uniref:SAP domain-containing protein n=1 Tax=Strongyloides venezuelensis TaxID=75913 RepID=A0A0K0EY96_STRVS
MNTRRSSARIAALHKESSEPQLNALLIPLLPVVRLKEELSKRGLKSTGRKDALVERLLEHIEKNGVNCNETSSLSQSDTEANVSFEEKVPQENQIKPPSKASSDVENHEEINESTEGNIFLPSNELVSQSNVENDSLTESKNDNTAEIKNDNIVEFKDDNITEIKDVNIAEIKNDSIAEFKNDNITEINDVNIAENVDTSNDTMNTCQLQEDTIEHIEVKNIDTSNDSMETCKLQEDTSGHIEAKNIDTSNDIMETCQLQENKSERVELKNVEIPNDTMETCPFQENKNEHIEIKSVRRKRRLFEEGPSTSENNIPPPETIVNLVEHYNNTIHGKRKYYNPLNGHLSKQDRINMDMNSKISSFDTPTSDEISRSPNRCSSIITTTIENPCLLGVYENKNEIAINGSHLVNTGNNFHKISENLYDIKSGSYSSDSKNNFDEYVPSTSIYSNEQYINDNDSQDKLAELMKDPAALLQKATAVLKNLNDKVDYKYEQFPCESTFVEDVKPLPEFHGEPVQSDVEEDDYFAKAAGIKKKKDKNAVVIPEEEAPPMNDEIDLDYYNADLHIKASVDDKWLIEPENSDGFALMWGGIRSNYGIKYDKNLSSYGKKFCFQVKIVDHLSLKHVPFEEREPYDIRVGWSLNNKSQALGDLAGTYCFNSKAMKATGCIFSDYGEPFSINDVITTILDISRGHISYYKNNEFLGIAFNETCFKDNDAIFAHIAIKNCKVKVNFGHGSEEDFPSNFLPNDVYFLNTINCSEEMVRSRQPPPRKGDCTVIMTVGLPGSGKTTWVRKYLRDNPDGHWRVISSDALLQQMRIDGIPRKQIHSGRWDMVMGLAAKAVVKAMGLACRRKHNYIIDGTNVSRDARKRKLAQFQDFQRKCVVLIPPEKELIHRQMKQEKQDGVRPIPAEAMLELKATMSIPELKEEPVEDIIFVEPEQISHALKIVENYNKEGEPWLIQKNKQKRQKHNAQINNHSVNN